MIHRLSDVGACLAVAIYAVFSAADVEGQVRTLNLDPQCPACRIVAEDITELGTDAGGGMLPGDPVQVTRDSAGRYWVAFNAPEVPIVFERDGTPLGPVGRRGEGPGEFRTASALAVVGDSMVVFDAQLGRASIVGPNLTVIRTVRLPGQVWSGVAVRWPWMALNMPTVSRSTTNGPYRLFNLESGVLSDAFGSASGASPTGRIGYLTNSANSERFWMASRLALRLSEWNLEASRITDLAATPSWFPTGLRGRIGGPNEPPEPAVLGISNATGSRLWMVLAVPRPNWRDGWSQPGPETPHGRSRIPPALALKQARLLLIDVETHRVIAMEDKDWFVISLLPGNEAALYDETDPLAPRIRIVRLSVQPS